MLLNGLELVHLETTQSIKTISTLAQYQNLFINEICFVHFKTMQTKIRSYHVQEVKTLFARMRWEYNYVRFQVILSILTRCQSSLLHVLGSKQCFSLVKIDQLVNKILCFGSWYHDFHSVLDSINKTVKAYPDPWHRFLSDLLILVCNCFLLSSFFLICIFDDEDTFVYLWENEKEWEKLVLVS